MVGGWKESPTTHERIEDCVSGEAASPQQLDKQSNRLLIRVSGAGGAAEIDNVVSNLEDLLASTPCKENTFISVSRTSIRNGKDAIALGPDQGPRPDRPMECCGERRVKFVELLKSTEDIGVRFRLCGPSAEISEPFEVNLVNVLSVL